MTRTDHAEDTARQLIDRAGRTYAQDAGITLKNPPSPLFELLVLALLLSTRISADIAVAAARDGVDRRQSPAAPGVEHTGWFTASRKPRRSPWPGR